MTFDTYEAALEAFCLTLTDHEQDMLDASGMLYDAFAAWCEARGHDWQAPA